MDAGAEDLEELQANLDEGIGHYLTSVADRLLADGLPVKSISVYSELDDPHQADVGKDVEGGIDFTREFQESLLHGPGEVDLHWCGVSGWCVVLDRPDVQGDWLDSAQWLGAGLTPAPERIAQFVSAIRLAPEGVGSADRPYYRNMGEEFDALYDRLKEFLPGPEPQKWYERRFADVLNSAYKNRALEAMTTPQQRTVSIPLRSGELAALCHLLEFVQATEASGGPGDLARQLLRDLDARVKKDSPHREISRHAVEYAVNERARLAELRRRDS